MKLTEKELLKREKLKYRQQVSKEKQKRKKQFSRSALTKESDRVFSLYIRWRDSWKPCCTCGAVWTEQAQCGHFASRRYIHTKWEERNAHWQCFRCNMILSGEQYRHWQYIDKEYWHWTAWLIHTMAISNEKVSDDEILETIQHYYRKCFELWIDYKPKKQYVQTNENWFDK